MQGHGKNQGSAAKYYKQVGNEGALRDAFELPCEFSAGLGDEPPSLPECPIIVLINSKSGGRAGPDCLHALRQALGYTQVRAHWPLHNFQNNLLAHLVAWCPAVAAGRLHRRRRHRLRCSN